MVRGRVGTPFSREKCGAPRFAHVPLTLAHLPLFHRRQDPMRIGANAERPEVHASQDRAIHSQWRGDRWPCWIRFQLFPRASALSKRCTVVDTVSEQYRTPPRSPIRARGQKCMLSDDARDESVSGACVPTAGMKARGRANTLIDLVSSSSIDGTVNVFTESVVLSRQFFPLDPLLIICGRY